MSKGLILLCFLCFALSMIMMEYWLVAIMSLYALHIYVIACLSIEKFCPKKTVGQKVAYVSSDFKIDANTSLVVVDASKNPVILMLPKAIGYLGQLHIVCADNSFGIEIVPNDQTQNVIFDTSNIAFNAKGDSVTLASDRASCVPSTWYVVGKYSSQWYA